MDVSNLVKLTVLLFGLVLLLLLLLYMQGNHGVLGIPDVLQTSVPVQVPGLWEVGVVQIAAGEAHCVALSAAGRVFSWGRGKYGQLGHGTYADQHTPKEVGAVFISCTAF